MTVYVDSIIHYPNCKLKFKDWCHMYGDDEEELHQMAAKIGMKREWFQADSVVKHYDITPTRRRAALKEGAVEDKNRHFLEALYDRQEGSE